MTKMAMSRITRLRLSPKKFVRRAKPFTRNLVGTQAVIQECSVYKQVCAQLFEMAATIVGPLSLVPAILAGGAAIMAIAGILFFGEAPSSQRTIGIVFAIIGLFLLRK
jgi:uncharacterized membrane protein